MINFPENLSEKAGERLDLALTRLPAYQSWRCFDPGPDVPPQFRFPSLPILTKRDIRKYFPSGFVPPGRNLDSGLHRGDVMFVSTSGTTEEQVTNFWHQSSWDAAERTSWQMNSHSSSLQLGDHPEALLASPLCVGEVAERGRLLPMEQRLSGRFLFLNETADPTHWTAAQCKRMLQELHNFAPLTLEANPAYLAHLARYAWQTGRDVYQPGLIILTFEQPSALHMSQIRRVFQCPIASSYGSTETGYVFMQCEKGMFHQNVETSWVDLQPFRQEHGGPALGRLLVTPLTNPWCIYLRFHMGDIGRLASAPCSCGRDMGITLASLEGRLRNLTLTEKGRAVTEYEVDRIMSAVTGIEDYQLIQPDAGHLRLLLVPEPDAGNHTVKAAKEALLNLYGGTMHVVIECREALSPQIPPGKYRRVLPLYNVNFEAMIDPGAAAPEVR